MLPDKRPIRPPGLPGLARHAEFPGCGPSSSCTPGLRPMRCVPAWSVPIEKKASSAGTWRLGAGPATTLSALFLRPAQRLTAAASACNLLRCWPELGLARVSPRRPQQPDARDLVDLFSGHGCSQPAQSSTRCAALPVGGGQCQLLAVHRQLLAYLVHTRNPGAAIWVRRSGRDQRSVPPRLTERSRRASRSAAVVGPPCRRPAPGPFPRPRRRPLTLPVFPSVDATCRPGGPRPVTAGRPAGAAAPPSSPVGPGG